MQQPPVPLDESRRLAVLRSLELLDTPAEERFDRITRLARRLFNAAAATISLVDESREWVKASAGFPHAQLARAVSMAAHAIAEPDLFVVEDTVKDARFYDQPLVTDLPRARFFAAHPLRARDASGIGALCVYDVAPRTLTLIERQSLADLAAIAEGELRENVLSFSQREVVATPRETSRIDPLTRLWNRAAMFDILARELDFARVQEKPVALLLVRVDRTEGIDEPQSAATGDWVLTEVARVLRTSLRPYDVIARFSGDEFAALLTGVDETNVLEAAERVRRAIGREFRIPSAQKIAVTIGAAAASSLGAEADELLRAAQSALWAAKTGGGNMVNLSAAQ
jgi:diguanylate cyclase (GGDEF)-like protein